ncbi:Gfo/Idh/MocA family oxidoreductase [Sphingomonas panacisoli]|uniref:Gfo/Idh/MocA family oxidoreductase n=1 Tax=Sphingomonas panacisoli TaxID=1813879 RepID=A0A5B8LIU9_9SPHN|nr:Gfo/Idh/MocA family oxidoreductase [Sphingomonas panacisoli]QDZ07856.1 Gfo/Idh/MocA family oxidoreductase [Sphingomonas panacisoli]
MRIGLLGASAIAPDAVIRPASGRDDVTVSTVAARDPDRASAYAAEHGIPAVAADYAALVARDDVDLVYCALPPVAHRAAVKLALDAGKPVLLEKPYAMHAADARAIVAMADAAGLPVIEAFHYFFHPQFQRALSLVADGAIGTVVNATASFDAAIPDEPGQLRWDAAQGGGGMMDLGCYCVHALRSLLRVEPTIRSAGGVFRHGVDATLTAQLDFAGIPATVHCSMLGGTDRVLRLEGNSGRLTLDLFIAPHRGGRLVLETAAGTIVEPGDARSTYDAQLDHVIRVFRNEEAPRTGGADAIANMVVIDACRAAAHT